MPRTKCEVGHIKYQISMAKKRDKGDKGNERRYRIASLIHESLAPMLQAVPRSGLLTLRQVALNNDYSVATAVYVYVGDEPLDEIQAALTDKRVALRTQLARQLNMRKTPELSFQYDEAGLAMDKMRQWLDTVEAVDESPLSNTAPAADKVE